MSCHKTQPTHHLHRNGFWTLLPCALNPRIHHPHPHCCSDETVLGTRLVELLEVTPLGEVSPDIAAAAAAGPPGTEQPLFPGATVLTAGSSSFEPEGPGRVGSAGFERVVGGDVAPAVRAGRDAATEVLGGDVLADEKLTKLMEVVMGRIDAFDLLPAGLARTKAQQVWRENRTGGREGGREGQARWLCMCVLVWGGMRGMRRGSEAGCS